MTERAVMIALRRCLRAATGFALACLLSACAERADESQVPAAAPAAEAKATASKADAPLSAARPERAVVSDELPYGEVGTQLVYGHFAFPSDMVEPLPAVVILHEWWGLTDTVRAEADRLAAQGYIVLAVDLFAGKTTTDAQVARNYMLQVVNDRDATGDNIRQAIDFVRDTAGAPSVAVMGWGLGGSWALNSAMLFPDSVDASIIYYGQVSDDPDRLSAVNVPVLGFFGENDSGIPVAGVRAFESVLADLGKAQEIVVYPGARHGFANPAGRGYDARLAERAWQRTLGFLAETLYSDES